MTVCNMSGMSRATSTLASSSPSGQSNITGHVARQQPRRFCILYLHLKDSLADEIPVFASHNVVIVATVYDVALILNVKVLWERSVAKGSGGSVVRTAGY